MRISFTILFVLSLLSGVETAEAAKIQFLFDGWDGPPLRVFVTRPVGLQPDRPVVIVMHGVQRNADDYRNQWHELAIEHDFLLVAPEFRKADFEGSEAYNFGNVFDESGNPRSRGAWSWSAIEPVFDEIRRRYGMTRNAYALYGHSAGAQFVHRFLFHVPDARLSQAVVANAGWYMMPDPDVEYPYGFKDSLVGTEQLEKALQLPVAILLGDEDIDPEHQSLRRTPEALVQGEHRFARGQAFFEASRSAARKLGVPFNWQIETVPGADHDSRLMALAASGIFVAEESAGQELGSVNDSEPVDEAAATGAWQLRAMSFNIWGGGQNEGNSIDETVAAIRAADADIVGLQEVTAEASVCTAEDCEASGRSVTADLATALGYYYYEQKKVSEANWNNAILSRYPMGDATPNDLGVAIDVDGTTVYAFNIHLDDFPYQPFQLLGIEYGDAPFLQTAKQAIEAARQTRQPALKLLFEDIRSIPWNAPAFIFGDFNEPSYRDWTREAVEAGHQPLAVRFPTARDIEKRGFKDAFRSVFPDEVARPAFTWTPTSSAEDPDDHHDRIDYVFVRGKGVTVYDAAIVGEKSPEADIVVMPWPSDHRAVVVTVGQE